MFPQTSLFEEFAYLISCIFQLAHTAGRIDNITLVIVMLEKWDLTDLMAK